MFFCFLGLICRFDFEAVNGDVWCAAVSCHFPVERCPEMELVDTCSSWSCCVVWCAAVYLLIWGDVLRWYSWSSSWSCWWWCFACSGVAVISQLRDALKWNLWRLAVQHHTSVCSLPELLFLQCAWWLSGRFYWLPLVDVLSLANLSTSR